jgi:outer membrane protein OmpU
MKNVLFATTALVLTAGVASAEVTFSGAAGAGVAKTKGTDMEVWSGIDLNVAASATTDSGITVSVSEDMGAGDLADYDDDYAIEPQDPDLQTPTVTVSMGATTISLENQAIDDLYDDGQNGDIGIATSFGDATVALTLDTKAAAGAPSYSYSVGYSMSGVSVSATGTEADANGNAALEIGASYTMGNITVGLTSDDNGQNGNTRVNDLTVTYVAGPATISVSADDNDDWEASIAYTAGAASVYFGTDESDAWEANVSYDLGGGVSLNAATNEAEYVAAGINFTF